MVAHRALQHRFSRAQMSAEYGSVYSFLCNESHNDLLTLLKRHIEEKENQRPKITFFKDPDPRDRIAEIFEAMEVSLFATEAIFGHCQMPLPKEYERWKKPIVEDLAKTIDRLQSARESSQEQPRKPA